MISNIYESKFVKPMRDVICHLQKKMANVLIDYIMKFCCDDGHPMMHFTCTYNKMNDQFIITINNQWLEHVIHHKLKNPAQYRYIAIYPSEISVYQNNDDQDVIIRKTRKYIYHKINNKKHYFIQEYRDDNPVMGYIVSGHSEIESPSAITFTNNLIHETRCGKCKTQPILFEFWEEYGLLLDLDAFLGNRSYNYKEYRLLPDVVVMYNSITGLTETINPHFAITSNIYDDEFRQYCSIIMFSQTNA